MPELRKDPITGRWVIIATDRAKRPTDFSRDSVTIHGGRFCPFCPGNESKTPPEVLAYRQSGTANMPGWTLRVVPNKFPALRVEGDLNRVGDGMYDRMTGIGAHEVIIETPDHTQTLADLPANRIADVFWAFRDRILDLARDKRLRYIICFKNNGEAAGASLEHTHSQLIALPVVPKRAIEELDGARKYYDFKERCVFCDMIRQEEEDEKRIVIQTDHFIAFCPYASRFPFETCILPRKHQSHFEEMDGPTMQNFGWVVRALLRKLNKTLENAPYNFMLHTAPIQEGPVSHYHWHMELIPKLTKVAGFEWGTGFYINPTPPEEAAKFLREAGMP